MKFRAAAKLIEESIHETLAYYANPPQHWLQLQSSNPIVQLLKEVRCRTKAVGTFSDSHFIRLNRDRYI